MKLPQNNEMRSIDKYAINNIGIPGIILMEKAAEKITYRILEELECKNGKTVLFICGKGNNGGDGFAAARLLLIKIYIRKYSFFLTKKKLQEMQR